MPTPQEMQAQTDAWSKQYDQDQAAKQSQETAPEVEQHPLTALTDWVSKLPSRVTTSILDTVTAAAGSPWGQAAERVGRDVVAGGVTGATAVVDTAHSALVGAAKNIKLYPGDPGPPADSQDPTGRIWEHAKNTIQDFTDAVKVKDPNMVDDLTQFAAQIGPWYAVAGRALNSLHGVAQSLTAGAAADATAMKPQDMRLADTLILLRNTDGAIGKTLQAAGPYGVNAYINYLAHNGPETEAQAHFKNALDGLLPNFIGTELIHAAGVTVKQGTAGVRMLINNGVRNSLSDLAGGLAGPAMGSPEAQAGKIGYHGTPNAPFDEFDNNAIGTGQGAQSFGYGHYIAENQATGETYQKSLSGRMNTSAALGDAQAAIKQAGGDKVKAFKSLTDMAGNEPDPKLRAKMENAARIIKSGGADAGKGSLIKVEIDDKHIANMVDLDKPLEKQPEVLNKIPMKDQKILQNVLDDHGQDLELGELTGNELRQLVERAHNEGYLPNLGANDGNAPRQASEFFSARGIPGHKYLDSKSRITGEGTQNYVVFDGKHIKVVKER